jgi:protein AbiQ
VSPYLQVGSDKIKGASHSGERVMGMKKFIFIFFLTRRFLMDFKLYSIDSDYVDYLRGDPRLINVFDNEEKTGKYGRKYIGIILVINQTDFYAPFSSPKATDYVRGSIRHSVVPIIRMIEKKPNGVERLLGTIKLNNMIPAPKEVCHLINLNSIKDSFYRSLLWKELAFVQANKGEISKNATIVFSEKTKEGQFVAKGEKEKHYVQSCVDFLYAIQKSKLYKK